MELSKEATPGKRAARALVPARRKRVSQEEISHSSDNLSDLPCRRDWSRDKGESAVDRQHLACLMPSSQISTLCQNLEDGLGHLGSSVFGPLSSMTTLEKSPSLLSLLLVSLTGALRTGSQVWLLRAPRAQALTLATCCYKCCLGSEV